MLHDDLLLRLMQRDVNAFIEMSEKYSWSVYSVIRSKISDKEKVEAVFHETMDSFYNGLHTSGSDDPMEALLQMYARKVCESSCAESAGEKREDFPGFRFPEPVPAAQPVKKKGGFFHSLCVGFLVLAIAAVIWVILGQLMDMNLIPWYDLGYTWFHANVLPWF